MALDPKATLKSHAEDAGKESFFNPDAMVIVERLFGLAGRLCCRRSQSLMIGF